MTHFLKKLVAAWFILGSVAVGFAQQMPPIPTDANVRIGKLENGLTYYIRHNNLPEKRADFYIAQKVGSILEDDNQRGLAHFLEHMCFNGTENFPGKTLISYLESIGVRFGENLQPISASTDWHGHASHIRPLHLIGLYSLHYQSRPTILLPDSNRS